MIKKELTTHYLLTLVWLVGVSLLRWKWNLELIGLWLGALVGTMILDLDQIFYALLIYPEPKAHQLWQQGRIRALLEYLAETYSQRIKLPFHNALFQVGFLVFSFWVLTSSGGLFGKGLVMAANLHLLKDEFHLLVKGREEQLRCWLFWPVRQKVSFEGQKIFVGVMGLVFLGLNLLLL
jgi:hypothetical protein